MAIILDASEKKKGIVPAIQFGHMAAPAILHRADYSTFEHSPEEAGKLLTLKKKNREERKREFGKNANKHLNSSLRSIGEKLHFTF